MTRARTGPATTADAPRPLVEHPIPFSGPMVRAILEGRKSQTRRVVKLPRWITDKQPSLADAFPDAGSSINPFARPGEAYLHVPCADDDSTQRVYSPFGAPGDRLWVRETWTADLDWPTDEGMEVHWWHEVPPAFRGPKNVAHIYYRADHSAWYCMPDGFKNEATWVQTVDDFAGARWNSWIHMPRWASRLTLYLAGVRVERLQDLTEEDARAEGCHDAEGAPTQELSGTARGAYALLWDELNGTRALWETNPWVWVLEFALADASLLPEAR